MLRIETKNYEGEFFIISTWIGILVTSLLLLVVSLFTSLSFLCFIFLALIIFGISLSNSSVRIDARFYTNRISTSWLITWVGLLVSVAYIATAKVVHYDAGLYHFQLTQWLSRFGTVPGLALLHNRFGFTSSWFALSAPFNLESLSGKTVALTGGLAILLAGLHFIISLNNVFKLSCRYNDHLANWFIIVSITSCLPYLVRHRLAVSSSPDTPVAILTMEIAWLILFISNQINDTNLNFRLSYWSRVHSNIRLLPLILACGTFAIKLSSLPLILISLAFYCFEDFKVRIPFLIKGFIAITVLITPVLIVNIVSSGCPLYPSPTLCTHLPWSVGSEEAFQNSITIRNWARWLGPTPENSNNWNWLIPWISKSRDSGMLIISSILSSIIVLFLLKKHKIKGSYYILAIAYIGILFLMYKAPSTRFGLGYLLTLPSFAIALILELRITLGIPLLIFFPFLLNFLIPGQWSSSIRPETIKVVAIIFFIIAFATFLIKKTNKQWICIPLLTTALILSILVPNYYYLFKDTDLSLNSRLLVPMGIQSLNYPDDFQSSYAMNFSYLKPKKGDQCWDSPLPCTPYLIHNSVKLRDSEQGFSQGFTLAN